MQSLKYILILIIHFLPGTVCFAQREKIDSLKKVLPSLRDSARVDCLNDLSEAYLKFNSPITPVPYQNVIGDTAAYYANLAFAEAVKINYIHGIAESLSYKGEIALFSDNFPAEERLTGEAIDWYRKTPNKKRLAETHYYLSHAFYAQSMFTDAIKNLDTAYAWHKKNGNITGMYWSLFLAYWVNVESGNYEKSFELAKKTLDIAVQNKNDELRKRVLGNIGWLFIAIEDYKTGLEYWRQSFENVQGSTALDFAEVFIHLRQYDSAKYYYSLADTTDQLRYYLVIKGEWHLAQKQYDKALPTFIRVLDYHRQVNDRNPEMRTLVDIAKTYLALGNNDSAFVYGMRSFKLSKETGAKRFIKDACEILAAVYDRQHQPDSAYFYFKQYTTMKDAVLNNQVKGKLAAYTFEQKMELLYREKQIQRVQLQKESLLKNILLCGVIVFLLLAIIVFRNIMLKRRSEANLRQLAENELQIEKLENEKKHTALQQQTTELQMQALRAQMNPHFIFNSLNSINRFILQNNKSEASEYLTKFSRLVRLILQNSQAALIPLESELEALKLYLELEAVRFDHRFDYKIIVDEDVDTDILKVPPLIIQPYAENAIWHGLMHKEEKGHLQIELFEGDEGLFCKIRDDGVGRKKAAELKSKSASSHKSMGMRITADRIAMLQQQKQINTTIKITDVVLPDGNPGGTEVLLKIPVML